MYQTQNYQDAGVWIKRIFSVSLICAVLITGIVITGIANTVLLNTVCSVGILFILMNQTDEITIDSEKIVLEQKSLIPFLRSKTQIKLTQIYNLQIKSDQVTNDRGWYLFGQHKKNILVVNTIDGEHVRISGNLHPKGVNGIKKIIEAYMNEGNVDNIA